jgi:catechol 2,3-dioxygenase-like lactoylglutathione lyase family enzyme
MYSVDKVEVILTVSSIKETQAWYDLVLGWNGYCDYHDAEGHCGFGCVIRGDLDSVADGRPMTGFNLSRFGGDPASYAKDVGHCTLFIKVDEVEVVYARVVESGVEIADPLKAQPWGGRTFSLYDLNGFHLTLYQLDEE